MSLSLSKKNKRAEKDNQTSVPCGGCYTTCKVVLSKEKREGDRERGDLSQACGLSFQFTRQGTQGHVKGYQGGPISESQTVENCTCHS